MRERDNITIIEFSVGSYFEGFTNISIRKNDERALVEIRKTLDFMGHPKETHISSEKWNEILHRLYDEMHLSEWKEEYVDPDVLDGTSWELNIHFADGDVQEHSGCNVFPSCWEVVEMLFAEFAEL